MAQWIKPNININFTGRFRTMITVSSLAITVSIGALVFNTFVRGSALNFGTDFRGGSEIQVEFSKAVTPAQVRGALNKLLSLPSQKNAGVIACSAGNHGQGVAFFAEKLKLPATVVMPKATPFGKVERTARYGAKVVLEGETFADAEAFTHELAAKDNLTFIGRHVVGAYVLRDPPCFIFCNPGFTQYIKKRCFPMIYMPHDSNNRRSCNLLAGFILLYF